MKREVGIPNKCTGSGMSDRSRDSRERSTSTDNYSFFILKCMKTKQNVQTSNFTDEDFLPTLPEQRDNILKNFDFTRVANIMAMNICKDWNTGQCSPWRIVVRYGYHVPTVDDLVELATDLMNVAIHCSHSFYITRSGPFRVIKAYGRLILDFVITSWSYD